MVLAVGVTKIHTLLLILLTLTEIKRKVIYHQDTCHRSVISVKIYENTRS
jgi:hypothetical protein